MPANPLFYRSVVPLNRESHAGLRLRTDRGMFGFARGTHLIPAVLDEFAAACRDLPILFIAEGQAVTPAFLVGTRPDDNLMIDAEGGWTGAYVRPSCAATRSSRARSPAATRSSASTRARIC